MREMKLEVLAFASARDAVGHGALTIEVPDGASVAHVVELLLERHAALRPVRDSMRFAVNEEFVGADHSLREGDRLALLPPVSGG
jgi:molybdopterin converting factor subunit 1